MGASTLRWAFLDMSGFFIAGTDTGVGKTLVTGALMHAARGLGFSVQGMKPVAAGCERVGDDWVNDDVEQLRAAASQPLARVQVNPYLLREAVAPHIAADHQGVRIELQRIVEAYHVLEPMADTVFVEGVGGLLVPIDDGHDMADVVHALGLPVILVVGMRLGCLNHALLTQHAMRARGLRLVAWVANGLDPGMPAYGENMQCLQQRLAVPLLAELPHIGQPEPPDAARFVANPRLHALLATV